MLGGGSWEAFNTAIILELGDFLRHVRFILYQDILMLDIELAQFKIEHFHNLFKVVVTCFDHFLSL